MTTDILNLLDLESTAWLPKNGEHPTKIVGKLVDVSELTSEYGSYPLLVILPEATEEAWAVHAFGTVLKGEIEKQRPQIGDTVGIKYVGIPAGKKYEVYRLVVQPGDGIARDTRPAPAPEGPAPTIEDALGEEPF